MAFKGHMLFDMRVQGGCLCKALFFHSGPVFEIDSPNGVAPNGQRDQSLEYCSVGNRRSMIERLQL